MFTINSDDIEAEIKRHLNAYSRAEGDGERLRRAYALIEFAGRFAPDHEYGDKLLRQVMCVAQRKCVYTLARSFSVGEGRALRIIASGWHNEERANFAVSAVERMLDSDNSPMLGDAEDIWNNLSKHRSAITGSHAINYSDDHPGAGQSLLVNARIEAIKDFKASPGVAHHLLLQPIIQPSVGSWHHQYLYTGDSAWCLTSGSSLPENLVSMLEGKLSRLDPFALDRIEEGDEWMLKNLIDQNLRTKSNVDDWINLHLVHKNLPEDYNPVIVYRLGEDVCCQDPGCVARKLFVDQGFPTPVQYDTPALYNPDNDPELWRRRPEKIAKQLGMANDV